MDIEFLEPLKFMCEILETEDHLPSIKFRFNVEVKQFSHELKYSGEIWIKCESLDVFINNLVFKKNTASLEDIDGNILIQITWCADQAIFFWSARRESITGDIVASSFKAKVSEDILVSIKESFLAFPKWW